MTFVFTCKNILKHQRAPSYAQKYQQLSNQKISRTLKLNMPRIPHNLYKKIIFKINYPEIIYSIMTTPYIHMTTPYILSL